MFGFGVVLAVPPATIAFLDSTLAFAMAVGMIPAAVIRMAPNRSRRWVTVIMGGSAAASMVLGSLLHQVPVLAVVVLLLLGFVAPLWAARSRVGGLVMALVLPLTGVGLSVPSVGAGLAIASLMLGGAAYAWVVSLLWPERPESPRPAPAVSSRRDQLVYGVLLGSAGAVAATTAFVLGMEHVGWVTGARLLVMRPTRAMLFRRSAGRALSVLVGAFLAAVFAEWSPTVAVSAVAIVLAVAAATATQGSYWYVTPGFTTFLALSLILSTGAGTPVGRFNERVGETLLGVGIALVFGWAVPSLLQLSASRRVRSLGPQRSEE
jgi:hypothetical protein